MRAITEAGQWDPNEPLPQRVQDFVDWLLTPKAHREPSSQNQWAHQHDVSPGMVSRWKKHPRVKELISERADELNLSPDRVQEVMQALFDAAVTDRNVKAMEIYLNHAEKLRPRTVVIEDRRVEQMSDEELEAEMAKALGITSEGL